jgi:hypothetical protein
MIKDIRSEIRHLKTDAKELRKFGITMAVVLGLLTALTAYRHSGSFPYLLALAVAFLGFGLLKPAWLKQIYLGWMTLAFVMGYIMTRVILTLLFFIVFVPIGLIARITSKDMLDEHYEPDAATYWKPYAKRADPKKQLERQF